MQAKTVLTRILVVILVTLVLVAILAYGFLFVLFRGPSPTARDRWARSCLETSAIQFIPGIFLGREQIEELSKPPEISVDQTDASLVQVKTEERQIEEHYTDDWGYTDEDDDGIILVDVPGPCYKGYMMIVLDPSRVVLGIDPETIGGVGHKVAEYVQMYDAVAGINGGGFEDLNGKGNGGMPDSVVVSNGVTYCAGKGIGPGFVGIDDNNILHVGLTSLDQLTNLNIRDGCGYGPVLVANGIVAGEELQSSGLNPRTAIGQRSDGAILMLVIDGRQPNSVGASYADEAEIMLRFGAVNAMNLDGGSSSLMWFQGKYINNNASVIGIRPIPTSFVVLKEGTRKG